MDMECRLWIIASVTVVFLIKGLALAPTTCWVLECPSVSSALRLFLFKWKHLEHWRQHVVMKLNNANACNNPNVSKFEVVNILIQRWLNIKNQRVTFLWGTHPSIRTRSDHMLGQSIVGLHTRVGYAIPQSISIAVETEIPNSEYNSMSLLSNLDSATSIYPRKFHKHPWSHKLYICETIQL